MLERLVVDDEPQLVANPIMMVWGLQGEVTTLRQALREPEVSTNHYVENV